jgi:PDZ domain/Aspartyl protease
LKRRILAVAAILGVIASLAPWTAAGGSQTVRQQAPVTLPFELVTRHMVLPVAVNKSRPLAFVLDTGNRMGVIDVDRARELGLTLGREIRVGGVGPEALTGYAVQHASFTLESLPGFSQPITLAIPLRPLAARFGHDFDGILGSEFIKEFVVEINYDARNITLHDRDAFQYSGKGASIPVRLNASGHPLIDARVTPIGKSPISGTFVIDLGSGGTLALHSPFVREHQLPGPDVKTIASLGRGGTGGATTGRTGRVRSLTIGQFTMENVPTHFSEDAAGAFASPAVNGDIGQQIMGRFRIYLDYGRDRLILEPTASLASPFDRATSGITFEAVDRDYRSFRIRTVLDNSPATEAGLTVGDVILAVDGRKAPDLTVTVMHELFEQPAPRTLTIQRGESTLTVNLTPRVMF